MVVVVGGGGGARGNAILIGQKVCDLSHGGLPLFSFHLRQRL